MTDAIVTHQQGLMPALTINEAVDRYNIVVEFTKAVMKPGKDYGAPFPGTNKPTLLKPGAEKLTSLFGLAPDFVSIDKIVDFETGMFYFQYQCDLYKDGAKVGSGIGSCNSRETKYRYRWLKSAHKPDKEEAERLKAEGIGRWRKFNGNWVWHERTLNTEPFDLVNTIDKMAQKRALVAATLIAANASEFFTQDIEDMGIIEGEFTPEPVADKEAEPEGKVATPKPKGNGNGKSWKPEFVEILISNNIAKNPKHAVNILNLLEPETVVEAEKLGKLYRGWRDLDKEQDEAVIKTKKGEVPK
jgi:hypothetical protein